MSIKQHTHNAPITAKRQWSGALPINSYGALIGTSDGPIAPAPVNANHVLIPLRVANGQYAGRYQLAFNTESQDDGSDDMYDVLDETIDLAQVPAQGFELEATLGYHAIGLAAANFRTVANGQLRSIVQDSIQRADLISAYGVTYSDGTGLHDIHYNNGEPPGSTHANRPNQDGALALYFLNQSGTHTRRWIFIKFESQQL